MLRSRWFSWTAIVCVLIGASGTFVVAQEASVRLLEGDFVVVNDDDVTLRAEATTTSEVVTVLVNGEELTVLSSEPVDDGTYIWWNVATIDGLEGWIVGDYIEPSGDGTVPPPATIAVSPSETPSNECWAIHEEIQGANGEMRFTVPPNMVLQSQNEYIAVISTSEGTFEIELIAELMPITTNNFVCLARAGFYDGLTFHYVEPGFFVQSGDPTRTSTGGPGYVIPSEGLAPHYERGVVAMANVGPDTNGSQFFIAVSDLDDLITPQFPVFGYVMTGMDVADQIATVAVKPVDQLGTAVASAQVVILTITIEERLPLAGPVLSPTAIASQPSLSSAALFADDFLPNVSELEGAWVIFDEGERSREEVGEQLGEGGEDNLLGLRWRENLYRDFTLVGGEDLPFETTFLSVSVHRFGTEEGAQEALSLFSDLLTAAGYQVTAQPNVGDTSLSLQRQGDGANLYVLFVQVGSFVIRIGASSIDGNPEPVVNAIAEQIVERVDD